MNNFEYEQTKSEAIRNAKNDFSDMVLNHDMDYAIQQAKETIQRIQAEGTTIYETYFSIGYIEAAEAYGINL